MDCNDCLFYHILSCAYIFQTSQDGRTNFLKVHAPLQVLQRYADIINMQKPIKASSWTFGKYLNQGILFQKFTCISYGEGVMKVNLI